MVTTQKAVGLLPTRKNNLSIFDQDLIRQALACTDEGDAARLKDQVQSLEAKEIIHVRMIRLSLAEEWAAGTL
ncbi:MAG: hypothetical protein AAGU19_07830 [Prolixibacteraceae bacterium]